MTGIGWLLRILTAGGKYFLPFLAMWLVLVALYKYLPHTRVRFKSAAWGALLAGILLQGARPLFTLYVLKFMRYEKIYGSLGAIPIFLVWIWLLWLIVLFGAEASFTIQNMGLLVYRDKLHRLSSVFIDRYLAARIMMYVAREFRQAGKPTTVAGLGETLQTTPEAAADAAGRLVKLGLLTPVGEEGDQFLPARDPARLKLSEILSVTDRFRDESGSALPEDKRYETRLEAAFHSIIRAQDQALHDMTLSDLLQQCEEEGGKGPSPLQEK
jgi:membrane protein